MTRKPEALKNIASAKQIKAIRFIEKACDMEFLGSTPTDVHNFIKKWLPKARLMNQIGDVIGSTGVQMAEVHFRRRGEEALAPEDWSFKGGLADAKFKGDIMRGRNPVDALCDLQERVFFERLQQQEADEDDFMGFSMRP